MLNPAGTLSFANGNLSAAAGMGGGATGASFEAASLPAGRPIRGEPGGRGAPAGAGAPGVLAGWAAALSVNALIKAPASNRPRGVELIVMKSSLSGSLIHVAPASMIRGYVGFPGRQCPTFFRRDAIGKIRQMVCSGSLQRQCLVAGASEKSRIASVNGN